MYCLCVCVALCCENIFLARGSQSSTLILAPREKIKITLTQSPKKKLFAKRMTNKNAKGENNPN